jgi:hypothetical protein
MFSISRDGKVEFSTPFEVCPDVSEDAVGIDAKVLADVGAGMVEDDGVAGRLEGVRNWRMSDLLRRDWAAVGVGVGCAVLATLMLAAKAGEVEVGALAEVEGLVGAAGVPFFFLPFWSL